MATTFGYVRVSSQDQNEERQLIALREKLVDPKQTFIDKQSDEEFSSDQEEVVSRRVFFKHLSSCRSTINGLFLRKIHSGTE